MKWVLLGLTKVFCSLYSVKSKMMLMSVMIIL